MSKLTNPDLYRRIAAHCIDHDHERFITKLSRLHEWQLPFARRACEEYLRFCYLIAARLAKVPLSPSHTVDFVWHLHLLHARDYWQHFCANALGMELHHTPDDGTHADSKAIREQYAQTLRLYEIEFGPSSRAFWPGLKEQFQARSLVYVDNRDCWVIAKPWRVQQKLLDP
jgi:hypothetical protein